MNPQIEGNELYHLLIELTGLDRDSISGELDRVMKQLKLHPATLTTEDLRRVMLFYLDEIACASVAMKDTEDLTIINAAEIHEDTNP